MTLSYDLTTFQILGQNLSNFFVGILVQTMTPKGHFEINRPLINEKIVHTKILIEHTRLYGTSEEGGDLLVFFQLLFVSSITNCPNLFLYNS